MSVVHLKAGLLKDFPDHLAETLPCEQLAVLCDDVTYEVVAASIVAMRPPERVTLINLGKRVQSSFANAEKVIAAAQHCSAMLAVGSGTINDLAKYSASALAIPYAVYATAPSMNGYVSPMASLIEGTMKQSITAARPVALFADLDILCRAPIRLIRSGLGDTICRSTIEADQILSHYVTGSAYDANQFDLLRQAEAEILKDIGRLSDREPEVIGNLMRALIVSGEQMAASLSSAPASQGEHMIAHTYDMIYGGLVGQVYHGEAISVTTSTMARLQQKLITRRPSLQSLPVPISKFEQLFGREAAPKLHSVYQQKVIAPQRLEEMNTALHTHWDSIRDRINEVSLKAIRIETILRQMGCPVSHQDLRWHKDRYEHAVTSAYLTRDRFTFLDIAAMNKMLRAEF